MELNIGLYPFVYIIFLLFGLGLGKKKKGNTLQCYLNIYMLSYLRSPRVIQKWQNQLQLQNTFITAPAF